MLKKFQIDQFVIIDTLDLDLEDHLTILTGETGAGKSILLGGLGLILGDTSTPESIRSGSDESTFRATFGPPKSHPVWQFLTEKNLAGANDNEFTIYRIMRRKGEDTITVNDKDVDLELLEELGRFIIEIHGQFANQSLTDPENQLTLLDLSGNFPPEVFKNVKDALDDVNRYTQELEDEKTFLARNKRDAKHIEDVVRRFESIGMGEGFIENLQIEYATLLTAKETSEAFQNILSRLIASDGVVVGLSSANQILDRQKNVDMEKMVDLKNYLSEALKNARSAVDEMGRLAPEYEIDLKPLQRCEEHLKILKHISFENKIAFEDLYEYFVDMSTRRERLRNGRARLAELEDLLARSKARYLEHAAVLSEKRKVAGVELAKAVTNELPPLKLEKAQFQVEVKENPNNPWTERGLDEVIFMARMNPGSPFSPISETASGGELARLMLGLKVIVQGVQTTPTLVFDEVDTGIGGAAAAAVGERIATLAEGTQVLVITHSPQVASRGDQHLHVSKSTDGETTISKVVALSDQERLDEISRMLAGDTITDEALAAAKSLISEASTAASKRRETEQA